MRSPSLGLLLLASACAARPPVVVDTPHGRVRAYSRPAADDVAVYLSIATGIKAALESQRDELPEIWILRSSREEYGSSSGTTFERRIELTCDAMRNGTPYHLAHELVHWYVSESPYERVPSFVNEGLADFIALDLLGMQHLRDEEVERLGSVTFAMRDLFTTAAEWYDRPDPEVQRDLTYLGYSAVRRLGLDRVRELASAGAGPLEYLEAADIAIRAKVTAPEAQETPPRGDP